MPIFEYRCGDCGKEFEAFVTAERTAACPGCQGENLAKLLSSPGRVGVQGRNVPAPVTGTCGDKVCACRPDPSLN